MALFEALIEGVAERAQRKDISRWEKAQEMLELQQFLREHGKPCSVSDLERLTGGRWQTISEQLTIATSITSELLERAGISKMRLARIPHSTLLRLAQMPEPMREEALREVGIRGGSEALVPATSIDARYRRRAQLFERFRNQGDIEFRIAQPLRSLTVPEAKAHLDQFLPVLASLAETVSGNGSSYYIGFTGNGGLFVYLGPDPRAPSSSPPEL